MGWAKPVTLWWNSLIRNRVFRLALSCALLFLALCFFFNIFLEPIVQNAFELKSCPITNCNNNQTGLRIYFENKPIPDQYTLTVVLKNDVRTLTCDSNTAITLRDYSGGDACLVNGAIIDADLQYQWSDISVEIIVAGKAVLAGTLQPTFSRTYPNGKECSPCTKVTLRLHLPE